MACSGDIVLLIVDIRYPALHFSPVFYKYCTETMKKECILVLNKIDLAPTSLVTAWKHYFQSRFPNIHILLFSYSKQIKYKRKKGKSEQRTQNDQDEIDVDRLMIKSLAAEIYTAKAHRQLYECVKNIVKSQVDLRSWPTLTENLINNSACFVSIGRTR